MRTRALSICASAALAAGLLSVAGGVAYADTEECEVLESTIRGQLAAMTPETAPGVIASVQALRAGMAGSCDAGPPIEQLIPSPAPQSEPQASPQISCGESMEIEQGRNGAAVEAFAYGLTQLFPPLKAMDKALGISCVITSESPEQAIQNICYIGKSIFPAGPVYAGIAEFGRATNIPAVIEFGQSAQDSWSYQCR